MRIMNENLFKDIIESNLSSNTKLELIKLLLNDNGNTAQPYYPYFVERRVPQQDWWCSYTTTC